MAGYSGTPLAKKLGIKDDFRVALLRVPEEVRSELQDALAKCRIVKATSAPIDLVFLFVKSAAELERGLTPAANALAPAGMLWISWPKKASGVATDLTDTVVRQRGIAAGLVDIKVCAVTDVWSGLKFVIPVKNRTQRNREVVGIAALILCLPPPLQIPRCARDSIHSETMWCLRMVAPVRKFFSDAHRAT